MAEFETLMIMRASDRMEVQLSRPERRNAINAAMVAELHRVLDEVNGYPPKLLIVSGAGGSFASGADIEELYARRRLDALRGINLRLFERLRRTPLPSICAIDGYALGGGAELAYACDLRIASTRAVFAQPEARLGILAGAGACYRLKQLVGESLAKELLFTGRQLRADDALRHGLVTRVVEPDQLLSSAHELADEVLKSSAIALRLTKMAVDAEGGHPEIDQIAQALLFEDEEKSVRLGRFLTRRSGADSLGP
jgi:enoyl-CoA hydratase/carnithine racemase